MYQNLNSYFSKKVERTYYIQGRGGTESENCLPSIQYYKSLEEKRKYESYLYAQFCIHFSLKIIFSD